MEAPGLASGVSVRREIRVVVALTVVGPDGKGGAGDTPLILPLLCSPRIAPDRTSPEFFFFPFRV